MNIGPIFNQIRHPWHWLTYGQNANAITTILAAVAASASSYIAIRTLKIVKQQTKASWAQARAGQAQVKAIKSSEALSEALLEATKQAAAEERRHADLVRYQILESLRPMIVFKQDGVERWFYFQNQGNGAAVKLAVSIANRPQSEGAHLRQNLLGPGSEGQLEVTETGSTYMITLQYHSVDGRTFETKAIVNDGVIGSQAVAEIGMHGEDKFIFEIVE